MVSCLSFVFLILFVKLSLTTKTCDPLGFPPTYLLCSIFYCFFSFLTNLLEFPEHVLVQMLLPGITQLYVNSVDGMLHQTEIFNFDIKSIHFSPSGVAFESCL